MGNSDFRDLIDAVVPDVGSEELMLAGLQATIASEITIRRQKLNMTQADLAELLGVSQSMVSRWESGDVNFTLETLVNIASKLNIKMQSPFNLTPAKAQYVNNGKIVYLPTQNAYRSAGRYVPEDNYSSIGDAEEM